MLPLDDETAEYAAKLLRQGEVVAIPTETVYGLAANAFSQEAVAKIFAAKGRPQDNPLIVHIADLEDLTAVAPAAPQAAGLLAKAFWPGPLTLVLGKSPALAPGVSAGLATAGVRMPAHPGARGVIRKTGLPLAAPSANLSGRPSPTCAAHVLQDFAGKIPLILDGGPSIVGVESTVLALEDEPVVLRPGFVTAAEIAEVLQAPVRYSKTVTAPLAKGEAARSPGTKYRHYAPIADLSLIKGDFKAFCNWAKGHPNPGLWALCYTGEEKKLPMPALAYGSLGDSASQSAGLFAALRRLDEVGAQTVYVRWEAEDEKNLAVYNRLLRAAAFRVVQA